MSKDYRLCLRFQLVNDEHSEKRLESLLKFCSDARISDVIFIINAEERFKGFIEKEQLKPYAELINKAKKALNNSGISVSMNFWTTFGHGDYGRKLKRNQKFRTMKDVLGNSADLVVCPDDEEWEKYYFSVNEYLVKNILPETVWIEDDFRFHNHEPLVFGGCFCDEHLKKYSEITGKKDDAPTFVKKMICGDECEKYRLAYHTVNSQTLSRLIKKMDSLFSVYGCTIGFMNSDPHNHEIEGRKQQEFFGNVTKCGKSVRIHLPSYRQVCSLDYIWNYNYISLLMKSLVPEDVGVYPEIESFPNHPYSKGRKNIAFQIHSSLSLCPQGITLNIFEMSGTGVVYDWKYQENLSAVKDYADGFVSKNISFSTMQGITVPVIEGTSLKMKAESGYGLEILYHNENWFYPYLLSAGLTAKMSHERAHCGKILAISGQYFRNFSEKEIEEIFANNFVILEAQAVLTLLDMNLGRLINVSSMTRHKERDGVSCYEKWNGEFSYCNVTDPVCTTQYGVGDIYEIEYSDKSSCKIYSYHYDYEDRKVFAGMVRTGNVIILPYHNESRSVGLLEPARLSMVRKIITEKEHFTPEIYTDAEGVCLYHYKKEGEDTVLIVNYFEEDLEQINLYSKIKYESIYYYDEENPSGKNAEIICSKDNVIGLKVKIKNQSSAYLILKQEKGNEKF